MEKGVILHVYNDKVMLNTDTNSEIVEKNKKLKSQSQYQVITSDNSYALLYCKAAKPKEKETNFVIFPNSLITIWTGNCTIESAFLAKGFIHAATASGIKLSTLFIEF